MSALASLNMHSERFNSPSKRGTPTTITSSRGSPAKVMLPDVSDGDDCFSFKLSQVPQKSQAAPTFDESLAEFDKFVQDQRVLLPQKMSQAQTPEERQLLLDEFFQLCDQQRLQVNKMYQDQKGQPQKRRTTSKGSPMKSPVKQKQSKKKENDENASPVKASSFSSPTKKSAQDVSPSKERRMSQQRRQREQQVEQPKGDEKIEDEICEKHLQAPASEEPSDSLSPLKKCPKSPVKRMKTLEAKEETKEDIEETYQKLQDKEEELNDPNQMSETSGMEAKFAQEIKFGQDAKSILGQKQLQDKAIDINDVLDVDSNVINYGQFICGKILGSTLLLTNISEKDQVIKMNVSKTKDYDADQIFGQYNREELPFGYEDGTQIKNAENDHNCWFIENPVSKELQKKITLKIGPGMSQEFIIVVKAPKNKLQSRIVSFVDIQLEEAIEKHVNHQQALVQTVFSKIEILLLGFLDNPKIKCMKQLFNKSASSDIVSLAVKKTQGIQRFKLPFKNLSSYLDSDIEFAFIRTQNQAPNDQPGSLEPIDCLSFYCQPNQLKINADQTAILTVQIKVNMDHLAQKCDQSMLRYPLNKLLVARLKNSQVLFSYFVSITLCE